MRGRHEPPHGSTGRRRGRRSGAKLLALALVLAALLAAAAVASLLRSGGREAGSTATTTGAGPARTSLRTVFTPPGRSAGPGRVGDRGRVGTGTGGPAGTDFVPGRLLVKFEDGTRAAEEQRVLSAVGGDLEAVVNPIDVRVVDVPPSGLRDAFEEIAASPAVEYVERDVEVSGFATPNDTLWQQQWGPLLIDTPSAWDSATGSPAAVVAVLDTGVDLDHPDLKAGLVPGYDFVNGDTDPSDDQGHGTAAAGVIAARTNNGLGQAGICWRCSIMPVKVLDADGTGSTSVVAAGIVWATDHGARVISLSLGGEEPTRTLADAVTYALEKDVILVASAGNSGNTSLNYPAAFAGVIGVAGTTTADSLYSWSNFGPWVQLAAPGCNVATYPDGEYVNFCGTSSAAPVVAGIAGLAVSGRPDASRAQIEGALQRSAVPLGDAVRFGRVSAPLALKALGVQPPAANPPPARPPAAPQPTAPAPSNDSSPATTGTPPETTTETPAGRNRPATIARGELAGRSLRLGVRRLPAGQVVATLTAVRARALTLVLLDAGGRVVASASGASPLRLEHTVSAGRYRFAVRGSRRSPFTLRIAAGG